MSREERLLEHGWRFALGGQDAPDPASMTPVSLPHDWCIAQTAAPDAPLGESQGFYPRGGIGWYRTSFTVTAAEPKRTYQLDFDGVFENSAVWINGKPVGGHGYGCTPFRLDVTAAVRPGENELMLRADCTREPADRWYSGCGLYRPVRLLILDEKHLDERQVVVTTALKEDCAVVNIRTGVDEPVEVLLTGPDGRSCSATGTSLLTLTVPDPLLWSADSPQLYRLQLRLMDDGRPADEITLRIGLREVRFVPGEGMFVNGERTLLRGVCLHQDLGCRGIAARPEMWRARLLTLKDMGCNCIRAAHHVHSAAFMDLCDELGFFVYEECFDKWHSGAYNRYFPSDWQDDLDAMLLRDRNRPSVIIWGVGNEVENQAHDSMIGTLTMLTARVREMDPTRPVTYAMNPHFKRPSNIDPATVKDIQAFVDEVDEREISDMQDRLACIRRIAECVDLIACNYQEQWYPFIHAMMPDKLILGTEIYQYFVGDPERFQNYTELPPALIAQSEPWIIGGCIWSGYDYLGESMGWPSRGWTGAPLRTNGDRRASYYMLRSFWNPEPMVHLEIADYTLEDEFTKEHWGFPPCEAHWDFPMYHKQLLPYLIATNCERVTIELPGRSIAAPPRGRNGLITGYLPYLPGTLTVRGFIGGREVCAQTLVTPGPAAALVFDPCGDLPAHSGYEILLTVRVRDAQGHPIRRDSRPVVFTAEGPASVIATDNGNLMELTPCGSAALPLWRGQASAVIRLSGQPGVIHVTARAEGLADAVLTLNIR